jgi:hypothetical protein
VEKNPGDLAEMLEEVCTAREAAAPEEALNLGPQHGSERQQGLSIRV